MMIPNRKLASITELESAKFSSFMNMMNALAAQWGLRQFTNWSKIWEYPWLWFHGLNSLDWQDKKLLDIGAEISPMPWFLATLGAKVVLTETDEQWLPLWQALKKRLNVDISWHVCKDEQLPCANDSVDIVTSFSVIEHQKNKKKAVDEVARVLKRQGIFALSFDICEENMGMTFPEWNGKPLTLATFDDFIWHHPEFNQQDSKITWNTDDIPEFITWHKKSADHHNYTVGAALLQKS